MIKEIIDDKIILITGGSGALGNALIERLLKFNPKEIRIFSRDEKRQYETKYKFPECKYILGDIRDYSAIRNAVRGVDIVIHAGAFKFLDLAEDQPSECIKSNVIGSINVIDAVKDERNVEMMLGISTDKAASPINVYGMSKHMMEKLVCEADRTKGDLRTKFLTVRYGNVMMTTGSVIPLWKKRFEENKPILVTNPNMTRFMFTLDDSIDLILFALENGNGGDIISVKMSAVLLGDVARIMADGKVPVEIIGERPGEKKDECLITDIELKDTIYLGDEYYLLRPHSNIGLSNELGLKEVFTSDNAKRLNEEEIKELLRRVGAIEYEEKNNNFC